jgi:hypothetical protein
MAQGSRKTAIGKDSESQLEVALIVMRLNLIAMVS